MEATKNDGSDKEYHHNDRNKIMEEIWLLLNSLLSLEGRKSCFCLWEKTKTEKTAG